MTSKERILATLAHREPDRVPFDLGATVDTSIHYIGYNNLLRYMGKEHLIRPKEEAAFLDIVTGISQIDKEVVDELKIDARGVIPGSYSKKWNDVAEKEGDFEVITDSLGAKWYRPPNGYYFDQKEGSYPLAEMTSAAEIEAHDWPDLGDPKRIAGLREKIEELGQDRAVLLGDPVGGIFALGFRLRGYMNFYLDLAGNPSFACSLLDKFTELKLRYWEAVLNEVGDLIDVAVFEDDLGQQDRTLVSPQMYRELVKPRHQRLFSFIKEKTAGSVKVFLHSDGSIYDVIPDLIEIGVDILNPIQVNAAKMESARLKKEFGDDLVFWGGGVDTQGVLSFGSQDEVRDEAKRRIDDLAPGGGFVFAAIHDIQPDVLPENIMAMWETVQDYGKY